MIKYETYEEPLSKSVFTKREMRKVYKELADKKEYPDFTCWLMDMLKSGVFVKVHK